MRWGLRMKIKNQEINTWQVTSKVEEANDWDDTEQWYQLADIFLKEEIGSSEQRKHCIGSINQGPHTMDHSGLPRHLSSRHIVFVTIAYPAQQLIQSWAHRAHVWGICYTLRLPSFAMPLNSSSQSGARVLKLQHAKSRPIIPFEILSLFI